MKKPRVRKVLIPTLYGRHTALLEPDERNGFIVTVPDLPAVISWGGNIVHAKEMAKEAIELCIECIAERVRHTTKAKERSVARVAVRT